MAYNSDHKSITILPNQDESHFYNVARVGSLLTIDKLYIILALLAGGIMQSYANRSVDAFLVALLFGIIGSALINVLFRGGKPELRAFMLTYAICIFVGGLAQCYSLAVFGNTQSTIDSFTFLRQISAQPPFTTMADIGPFNSPLAVVIWQQVYKLTWWLGFDFGPYIGVMFNALVMGLTGSLTVSAARELFGDDARRLRRVGTLFALCGLFILFGAVLIRDCFTTFLNVLVLWGLVRWLVRPTQRNLLFAVILISVSAYAMSYLRLQAVLLFGLYGVLAFVFWLITGRMNKTRLIAGFFTLCVLLIAGQYIVYYMQISSETQVGGMVHYAELGANASSDDSLGMRLVVNQSLPVRLVMGSGMLMVSTIPLWNNFNMDSPDIEWIKGYHGIYQLFVMPLFFAGLFAIFHLFQSDRKRAIPLLFLAAYLLMNMAAVVATSLEQRHMAQFMPAFIILAALPDTRVDETRKGLRTITILWFATIALVHLIWLVMKGIA